MERGLDERLAVQRPVLSLVTVTVRGLSVGRQEATRGERQELAGSASKPLHLEVVLRYSASVADNSRWESAVRLDPSAEITNESGRCEVEGGVAMRLSKLNCRV